jgi:hypothetical protein
MAEFELDSDYERDDDNEGWETKRWRLERKSRPTIKAVRYEGIFLTSTESQDGEDEPVDIGLHLIKQLIRDNPGYNYQWPKLLTLDLDKLTETWNSWYKHFIVDSLRSSLAQEIICHGLKRSCASVYLRCSFLSAVITHCQCTLNWLSQPTAVTDKNL